MSFIIILALAIVILYNYLNIRPMFTIVMLCVLFSPRISVGNTQIDGGYIIAILMVVLILINGRLKKPPVFLKLYLLLILILQIIYFVSWIIFNRNDLFTMIQSISGAVKIAILMYGCWVLDTRIKNYNLNKQLIRLLTISVFINFIAVIYEMIDLNGSIHILSSVFLNNTEQTYLQNTIKSGYYDRYYGIFSYPMMMGLYSVFAISYAVNPQMKVTFFRRMAIIIGFLFIGLASGTKTFVLGTAVVAFSYLVVPIIRKQISAKRVFVLLVGIIAVLLFVLFFDTIYNFITEIFSISIAGRLNYLKNWASAFDTRFGSEIGVLNEGRKIIKQFWFTGVGPSSLKGEAVMDNTYYVIIHNGGILALLAVIIFYIKLLKSVKNDIGAIVIIIALFATGMGFQTLILSNISTWVIYELCMRQKVIENFVGFGTYDS